MADTLTPLLFKKCNEIGVDLSSSMVYNRGYAVALLPRSQEEGHVYTGDVAECDFSRCFE